MAHYRVGVSLWPFGRRRRQRADIALEHDRARLDIHRLKVDVAKQIAADDPRAAAVILWGGSRGAAQTLGVREPSVAEKYLEKKLLKDAEEDGFDRLLKVREFIREEREEMGAEYDRSGAIAQAFERWGPTLMAGLASVLNPAGYQAALLAAQQAQQAQRQPTGQPLPPPPGGTQVGLVQPVAVGPAMQSGARPAPAVPEPPEEVVDEGEPGAVIAFPLRASTVLANLDQMPPAVFARWSLEQPMLGQQIAALAQQTDDQLWKSLETAAANPLAGEFRGVFAWLRNHPPYVEALITSIRAMTVELDEADDVAL